MKKSTSMAQNNDDLCSDRDSCYPKRLLREYTSFNAAQLGRIDNFATRRSLHPKKNMMEFWPHYVYAPSMQTTLFVDEELRQFPTAKLLDSSGQTSIEFNTLMRAKVPMMERAILMAAWRASNTVYRFPRHPGLSIMNRPLGKTLPVDALTSMAERCAYFEIPLIHYLGRAERLTMEPEDRLEHLGFFAYYDYAELMKPGSDVVSEFYPALILKVEMDFGSFHPAYQVIHEVMGNDSIIVPLIKGISVDEALQRGARSPYPSSTQDPQLLAARSQVLKTLCQCMFNAIIATTDKSVKLGGDYIGKRAPKIPQNDAERAKLTAQPARIVLVGEVPAENPRGLDPSVIRAIKRPVSVLEQYEWFDMELFKTVTDVRANPEKYGLPAPSDPHCYVSTSAVGGLMKSFIEEDRQAGVDRPYCWPQVQALTALTTWKATKGVYVFDPTLIEELRNSSASEKIPSEVLFRMPEWCVYVACPGTNIMQGVVIHGFYAHLDKPAGDAPWSLCFVLDLDTAKSSPLFISSMVLADVMALRQLRILAHKKGSDIGDPTLCGEMKVCLHPTGIQLTGDSVEDVLSSQLKQNLAAQQHDDFQSEAVRTIAKSALEVVDEANKQKAIDMHKSMVQDLLSMVLYLCTDAPDINVLENPLSVETVPTPTGNAKLLDIHPKLHHVGFKIGAAIRAHHAERQKSSGASSGTSVAPHIRRAHWHTFWQGKRTEPTERRVVIRWLPPISVNADSSEVLVPTAHLSETVG